MSSKPTVRKNFWLWGTWGKRVIKAPFLTQKVDDKIRNIVIGQTFIIALNEDGKLFAWGEDKLGCLGLGTERTSQASPTELNFPSASVGDGRGKVIDIQYGKHHVLALTNQGKVYAWGENQGGQLGANDTQTRYEPVFVEELKLETVIQILAVDNMSYALTNHGVVYAWGENKDGVLALEHENPRVCKPEPMMAMKENPVKKLEIKEGGGTGGAKAGKTIIAYVELADLLPPEDGGKDASVARRMEGVDHIEGVEKDIFEGVDLMRQVMDNTQGWWDHMLTVRHGSPYDDNPTQVDDISDRHVTESCTALQLDRYVALEVIDKASSELDGLIDSAWSQLMEIKNKRGTKNVKFMLAMFMDDCKLRREKIRRTVAARKLMDLKKADKDKAGAASAAQQDMQSKGDEEKLKMSIQQLKGKLEEARKLTDSKASNDFFTMSLQESLVECIGFKLELQHTQVEFLKVKEGKGSVPVTNTLRPIKEKWGGLKRFSIYNHYQEQNLRGQNKEFQNEDEMLAFLVRSADAKIDQIVTVKDTEKDTMVNKDSMVPALCYDLLVENAELRKMCNTYQLKVLLLQDKEGKGHAAR